jgi:uncharacterized membrane protein YphA (DoxX/SURF4 family)
LLGRRPVRDVVRRSRARQLLSWRSLLQPGRTRRRSPVAKLTSVRAWLRLLDVNRVAFVCGLIFVPAGLVKFVFYSWELRAFRDFGIPAASIMEPLVGLLETVGGVLLVRGVLVVPTALVLAGIMLVAFVAGGIIHGSPIPSDTLAPVLLVAMIYLIRNGLRPSSSERTG